MKYSLELRLALSENPTIYTLCFVDMGNVWLDFDVLDPFDLKRSVGIGGRVFIPMLGMLGYDIAYGFDYTEFDYLCGKDFDCGRQLYSTLPHGWEYHIIFGMPF